MKKLIAFLLTAVMLLSLLTACSQSPDNSADVDALRQEVETLRQQVDALQQRLEELEAGAVSGWTLTGVPLTQGSGAAVTLTATPTRYQEGQMAAFRVMLDNQVAAELYCDWDGTAYTASMELDAADGYSYYLILTQPDGSQEHLDLNSPMNPVDPTLVYMYSSLSASCILNLYDTQASASALTLSAAAAEVQLPKLTATGDPAACTGAALVLQLNGADLERKALTIPQEASDPLILDASGVTFSVPELEEGSQLDLWLEVTLSDGQVLTHFASSWYFAEGELIQAVG